MNHVENLDAACSAEFHVYEDEIFLGKRLLTGGSLSIGRSRHADILLNHKAVADIHAVVHRDGRQMILDNHYPSDGLKVNGLSVRTVPLKSKDIINIGPFDIHVEINLDGTTKQNKTQGKEPSSPKQENIADGSCKKTVSAEPQACRYNLILVNKYPSGDKIAAAAKKLSHIYKKDEKYWLAILAKDRFGIKNNLDYATAVRFQKKLASIDVLSLVEPDNQEIKEKATRPRLDDKRENRSQVAEIFELDDDELEETEWIAPFYLKDKLTILPSPSSGQRNVKKQLTIVKTIGETVADVIHLEGNAAYKMNTEKGSIKLAENKAKGFGYVYFGSHLGGYIKQADQTTKDLDHFKQDANLFSRRRQLYRMTVPEKGTVVLMDGDATYRIQETPTVSLHEVRAAEQPKSMTWRHWAVSFAVHLLAIFIVGVFYYFQATAPVEEKPFFVKIDLSLLRQLEKEKIVMPAPKKETPPPKPEPQKVVEKVIPPKKEIAQKPVPNETTSKKTSKRVEQIAQVSKHPKAGGGYGEGNTQNRDIKQTGLLSLLGNSNVAGPSEAIASVTNLDAVPSPGAGQKNFVVGGIKGSLGNGKIAVSNDTIIQTKGSTQVLRSAGAEGPGRVAALEKGATGTNQVKGLVTAKMTRTVKIEGGMSREAVKQVIDQHLDEITMCYETALLVNPSISGRVIFEWKILMSGAVGEISIVASNINSNEIHNCIKSAIKGWQFPKPTGSEVVVSYPFVFDLVTF